MNKRQKEIFAMMPLIIGKRVEIWPDLTGNFYKLQGVVVEFTGTYLVFDRIFFSHGKEISDKTIHTNRIKKIIILEEHT